MPVKFLINPIAGGHQGRRIWNALKEACGRLGYVAEQEYSLEWTCPGHVHEQARRAAASWDRVVAVGGDGTVRSVAEGLLKAGTGAVLGAIPQGTGNDFARALGLYTLWSRRRTLGLEHVVRWLNTGPSTLVDVLSANDQLVFLSYCSMGLDAEVSRAYEHLRRHRTLRVVLRGRVFNECAYALLALVYARTRLSRLRLQLDMPTIGWMVQDIHPGACALIVSNVSSYGGGARLAAGSSYDDGLCEVTLIPGPWVLALLMASRFWPRLRQACQLESWRVQGVHMTLPRGYALQVDGEDYTERFGGNASLAIRVAGQIPVVCGVGNAS